MLILALRREILSAVVAVLQEAAARPVAGNSAIKNASPKAGIFKSDKVRLMPGL